MAERRWAPLAAVASGGALGGLARYALARAVPDGADGFPWSVLLVNAVGCALIGVLMALTGERNGDGRVPFPLARPFLGVGVLGGFTTFSAYAADVVRLCENGSFATAGTYLVATLVAALGAVGLGASAARRIPRRPDGRRRHVPCRAGGDEPA